MANLDKRYLFWGFYARKTPVPGADQKGLARPPGLEPGTTSLEGWGSIHLSYGRTKAGWRHSKTGRDKIQALGLRPFRPGMFWTKHTTRNTV